MVKRVLRPIRRVTDFLGRSDGNLTKQVVRSGMWVSVSHGTNVVLEIVRQVILARLLPPEAFGLVSLCLVVTRGLELFTDMGMGPALVQRKDRVEEATDTAFTMRVARGVALMILTWPLAPLAASYYAEPRLRNMLLVLSVIFLISSFINIQTILFYRRLDFRRLTMLDLSVAIGGTITVVAIAFAYRSVWALVFGQLVSAVLRMGLSYALLPGRVTFRYDGQLARELMAYGRYITGFTILQFISSELDNIVVGKVLGFQALGYYGIAFRLANLPATHIQRVAALVIFPAYSSLQDNLDKLRAAYLTVLRAVGGLAIPAAVGLGVLAPEVMRIVYGERWLPAAPALRLLAIYGLARSIVGLTGNLHNAVGKPHVSFYLTAGKFVLTAASIYHMTVWYGIEGTALAVSGPQVLMALGGLFAARSQVGIDLWTTFRALARILLASAAMGGVLVLVRSLLPPVGVAGFLGLVAIGILVYGALSLREMQALRREVFGARGGKRPGPPVVEPAPSPIDL